MENEVRLKGRIYFVPYEEDGITVMDHPTDITEAVQAMYDVVIMSSDFGSNYFSAEDTEPVVQIGKLMGFAKWEEAEQYVNESKQSKEQQRFQEQRREFFSLEHKHRFLAFNARTNSQEYSKQCGMPNCFMMDGSEEFRQEELKRQMIEGTIPHDHVFSSLGICMWPRYKVQEDGV